MKTSTAINTTTITIAVPNAQIVWDADAEGLLPQQQSIKYQADFNEIIGCPLSEATHLYCNEFSEELDRLVLVDDLLFDIKECQANGERNQAETAVVVSWLASLRVAFPDLQVHIYTEV